MSIQRHRQLIDSDETMITDDLLIVYNIIDS
ncbi:hypothetical protein TorRG33x02_162810 [Trema orientale]|uniref:Uncharacterized protein n=1 Tax=Trema orientale TaxID=63057 RepID=A0A2P5EQW2_TREOI|nr:hypothetical protein TorRG33x02_162810 [Trema orientale]